jgi:hypothetical protein
MARIKSGALGTLVIATGIALASAWMIINAREVYCDRLAPLTVLATLSAFAIALCFRQLGAAQRETRWMLACSLLLAGVTLFADARFVVHYRPLCGGLQQQLQQLNHH